MKLYWEAGRRFTEILLFGANYHHNTLIQHYISLLHMHKFTFTAFLCIHCKSPSLITSVIHKLYRILSFCIAYFLYGYFGKCLSFCIIQLHEDQKVLRGFKFDIPRSRICFNFFACNSLSTSMHLNTRVLIKITY